MNAGDVNESTNGRGAQDNQHQIKREEKMEKKRMVSKVVTLSLVPLFLLAQSTIGLGSAPPPPPPSSVEQPTTGYGSNGPYDVGHKSFRNTRDLTKKVHIFYPIGATPAPTIFFSHGYTGSDPKFYQALINHLVSNGYSVVFPDTGEVGIVIYPLWAVHTYELWWHGMKEAVKKYPYLFDTDRVGFIGHSLGGGAVPWLCYKGVEKGWGDDGLFMIQMAPFYSYNMPDYRLKSYPSHTKYLCMVYDDDTTNDHRMAIDIYNHVNIPDSEKDYILYKEDSNCSGTMYADHNLPVAQYQNGSPKDIDGLDFYSWRHIDALADYAFTGSTEAKEIALGNNSNAQRYMGEWTCDGTPVRECEVTDDPEPSKDQNNYLFRWLSPLNPRVLHDGE